MKKKKIIVFLAVIVFLVQAACAVGTTTDTPEPQAPPPAEVVADTPVPVILPTNTPVVLEVLPTQTFTPVPPTSTPVPSVQGSMLYGANCRSGPGANFPLLVVYNQGTLVNVIGTNKATDGSTWWVLSSPGQENCWMIDLALAITGDKSSVVKVVSPATPTPVPPPNWSGTWTYWMRGGFWSGEDLETGPMTIVQTGNYITSTYYGFGGGVYKLTGTVSADGMTVDGSININFPGFTPWNLKILFKRNPNNLNQFRGSWYNQGAGAYDGDLCGAINGASQPSPCKN